jgi:DNA-directed RNA polymerase subunit RPC12/RpoP
MQEKSKDIFCITCGQKSSFSLPLGDLVYYSCTNCKKEFLVLLHDVSGQVTPESLERLLKTLKLLES